MGKLKLGELERKGALKMTMTITAATCELDVSGIFHTHADLTNELTT